jgi:hypothetical protein
MLIPNLSSSSNKHREIYEGDDLQKSSSSKALMVRGNSTFDTFGHDPRDEYHYGPAGNPERDEARYLADFEAERERCKGASDVAF